MLYLSLLPGDSAELTCSHASKAPGLSCPLLQALVHFLGKHLCSQYLLLTLLHFLWLQNLLDGGGVVLLVALVLLLLVVVVKSLDQCLPETR